MRQTCQVDFPKSQLCSLLLKVSWQTQLLLAKKPLSFSSWIYQRRMSPYLLTRPAEEGLSTLHHHTDSWIKPVREPGFKRQKKNTHMLLPHSWFYFFFLVYWSPTPAKNNGASCSLSAAHQTGSYKNKSLSSFNLNFESINPNSFRQTSKIQFMYILSTSCT